MIEATRKGVFKGILLRNDGSNLSLLQFADDALFFGKWSQRNALNLIRILGFFDDASGLKINLTKSNLYGVCVNSCDVMEMARVIKCSHVELPFTYLGLPVGKKMGNVEAWNVILDRFTNRLTSSNLSIGGRLSLL